MLSLYYYELMEKIEEHEAKKYLMIDDYMLNMLDKIKVITGTEKFDNAKKLIDTDDKLANEVT